jgi:hypothetical protein
VLPDLLERQISREPKAKEALQKEWDRLIARGVWDTRPGAVREWRDVATAARNDGSGAHMGMLFEICVEKGSELAPEFRKYKGRVVFQGNAVKNQDWEAAMFQDLGSSPASMEAGKAADIFGSFPGHDVQQADAEQAYVQAPMTSPVKTWVLLPKSQWPKEWEGMHRPVVPLIKALYGHPDSGTYWETHCDNHCRSIGFDLMQAGRLSII